MIVIRDCGIRPWRLGWEEGWAVKGEEGGTMLREKERESDGKRERERRENEIIGATSKTREPRGYPRGNVIGSWARGGPFGGAFWVKRGVGMNDRQSVVSTRGEYARP